MSEVFTMEPGLDYELIDPDQGRQVGYFRNNQYFEGDFSRVSGSLVNGQFHMGGRIVGELRGNLIRLGGEVPYTLELRRAQ